MTRVRSKLTLTVILVLVSPLAGTGPMAERLPDWARDVAKAAPATPEGLAPYPERVLMSEVRYAVQEDGCLRVRRRLAVQELGTDPDGVSVGFFHLNTTARIEASRCWLLPPRGRASREEVSPIDVTVSDNFLTDSKVRAIVIDGVVKGSIVFFEFEALDCPYFVSLLHLFYESAPVQVARFELEIPAGWRAEPAWIRGSGPGPADAGRTMTWELRGLSAPLREPLGPDPLDEAPLLGVHLVPPADARLRPKFFADWASMSVWYDDLARDRREVSPEIRMEAGRLAGGGDSGILAMVLAAARYVRDSVRYVDIELGIGGYQPHAASETLSNLYGDCKDKATLLGALLAARDIPSYPVLVNLTSRDTVDGRMPIGSFNHLVLAVPLQQDLNVPLSLAHAVADAGELGRVLIIDVTDERTAIGSLSADLAGKRALLVAGTRGRLINLPLDDASWHTITRRILSRPDGARRVIERASTYSGEFAAAARRSYGSSALERKRGLERRMLGIWPGAAFLGSESEQETAAGDYVETVRLGCASLSCSMAADRFDLFPGAGDEVDRVPLGRRTTAVQYAHRLMIRYLSRYEGLSLADAPAARRLDGAGWSVETSHTLRDGVLESAWEVRLERTRFEPDAFAELKRFWAAVSSTAATTITLDGQAGRSTEERDPV